MNRIDTAFARLRSENRQGLIPFVTAGDPSLSATRDIVIELARIGATVIELGIPFSDPMADGPVIQRASERALCLDFGIAEVLDLVAEVRQVSEVPIVLFSYYNPVLQYGLRRLCAEGKTAGIDGVLITDLSPEESEELARNLAEHNLSLIFLVAPTSTDLRLKLVAERASGFIYAVSRAGVTGEQHQVSQEAEKLVRRLRKFTQLPIAVGFGISNAQQVSQVWDFADAAVVGSALVAEIERHAEDPELVKHTGAFASALLPSLEERADRF
ncbi:MAG: tryptophan synthase subunit alpha [Pyrinomonadaceae bacterium]